MDCTDMSEGYISTDFSPKRKRELCCDCNLPLSKTLRAENSSGCLRCSNFKKTNSFQYSDNIFTLEDLDDLDDFDGEGEDCLLSCSSTSTVSPTFSLTDHLRVTTRSKEPDTFCSFQCESPGEAGGSQYVPYFNNLMCSPENAPTVPKHFPIFKPNSRTVYLIRHGESEFNAADSAANTFWDDPTIFDAPLTAKGQFQARLLGPELRKLNLSNAIWVCSPMTRCLQTCLLAREAAGLGGPSGGRTQQQEVQHSPRLYINHDLTEKLDSSGDVGQSRSELMEFFPELEDELSQLPKEKWWWAPDRNNCQERKFTSREPKKVFQSRVGSFRGWIMSKQESNVFVVFGHSTFFKEFQGGHASRLKNGQIVKFTI